MEYFSHYAKLPTRANVHSSYMFCILDSSDSKSFANFKIKAGAFNMRYLWTFFKFWKISSGHD
jgi:hypothetical protein